MPLPTSHRSFLFFKIILIVCLCLCHSESYTQAGRNPGAYYVSVPAGEEYKKGKFYQWLLGTNHRLEWITPVDAKIVLLDTLHGGLMPYKKGGGNESKTLRLRSERGKEYVMRSVNKSRKAVTPGLFRGSFISDFIQDGVSMSHPYACLAIAGMSSAAGVFHPQPVLVYIPRQPALDDYNDKYGDDLYLVEERPEGSWEDDANMGYFKQFESTLKLLKKMQADNEWEVDQRHYIRSRLFDILLADWDRQQDNWRWGTREYNGKRMKPFSRDRDQAFFVTDGKLTRLLRPLLHVRFMQNFFGRDNNATVLTLQDRDMDNLFANEMSQEDWASASRYLQTVLTDSVIEASVKNLPATIYHLSGDKLISKLKARRDQLGQSALDLYKVLARKVAVNGSEKDERFVVTMPETGRVLVRVFRLNNKVAAEQPYYSRVFAIGDTRQVTMFGFGGNDEVQIDPQIRGMRIHFTKGHNKNHLFKKDD